MIGDVELKQALARLVRLLGENFVRYVLTLPNEESIDDAQLSPGQREVLELVDHHATSPDIGDAGALDIYMRMTAFSSYVPDEGTSFVNVLRRITGGQIEEAPTTGDAVVNALLPLARDMWPVFLIHPLTQGPRTFWSSASVNRAYDHPAFPQLVDAFLADEQLMKLFPFPPDARESHGAAWETAIGFNSLFVASGHGGGIQMLTLLPSLLTNAVFRCKIAGDEMGLLALIPHIAAATHILRLLACGETAEVPALVGFAGVQLPEGKSLDLPEGRLRTASASDRELFLADATSLTAVLETRFPLRIYSISEHKFDESVDPFPEFAKFQPRMLATTRAFDHEVDLVRLSLLLASSTNEPWVAREVARYISDPLSHGGISSWHSGSVSVPTHELGEQEFEEVRRWHGLVRANHVRSLDVGVRRLLSAATMRTDPIDAFVDAVICWENIFGVQTETTFRVTAAISKFILADDSASRGKLQKELKDLYAKRSRLVHGGAEPDPEDVDALRRRAIEVATDCFRLLYRDRTDLLDVASEMRGARLLLE